MSKLKEKTESLGVALKKKESQLQAALQEMKTIQEQATLDHRYIEQSQRREKALENETNVQAKHVRVTRCEPRGIERC